MRRGTPGAERVAELQGELLRVLAGLDQEVVVEALEPLCTDARKARLAEVFGRRLQSVTLLMDAPHDPHNGAAIVRSADAFGLSAIHVVERHESFLAQRHITMGSERWVQIHTHPNVQAAVGTLRASGFRLVAAVAEGQHSPQDLRNIPKVALVLGNEKDGILQDLRSACDETVRIPMRGFVESLNVSVASAILLQNATEGRPGDLSSEQQRFLYTRALVLTVPHAAEVLAAKGVTLPQPIVDRLRMIA